MVAIAALAVLVLLVWAGRGGLRRLDRGGVRVAGGALAVLLLAVAGFVTLRGEWVVGLVLLVMSLGGMFAARRRSPRPTTAPDMSAAQARSILGVGAEATDEEIEAAYRRLMRMAHPDKGGTSGLAAQLNAARERLVSRR